MIIGLSRDGRKIYGPKNSNGDYWQPCDVDYCNGVYLNGEYVYVATYFFPYIMACYGPSNNGLLIPSCSSNPRKCTSTSITKYGCLKLVMLIFIILLLILA